MKNLLIILLLAGMVGCTSEPYNEDWSLSIKDDTLIMKVGGQEPDSTFYWAVGLPSFPATDTIQIDSGERVELIFIELEPEYMLLEGEDVHISSDAYSHISNIYFSGENGGHLSFYLHGDSIDVEWEDMELNEGAKIFIDFIKQYVPNRIDSLKRVIEAYEDLIRHIHVVSKQRRVF